eukprot:12858643-Alexandrium_andersonii.AAC.1
MSHAHLRAHPLAPLLGVPRSGGCGRPCATTPCQAQDRLLASWMHQGWDGICFGSVEVEDSLAR